MDSYNEIRRVRKEMSAAAGHDIRKLIAHINEGRSKVVNRLITTKTELNQDNSTKSPAINLPQEGLGSPSTITSVHSI